MQETKRLVIALAAAVALAMAIDAQETLKATAPTPQSPMNDERLPAVNTPAEIVNVKPTLVTGAARARYPTTAVNFQYRFQVFDAVGTLIEEAVSGTSFTMTRTLTFNTRYTWRVRAEQEGAFGPWSTNGSFVTPVEPIPPPPPPPPIEEGFRRTGRIWDPLTSGTSVGTPVGSVSFIAGQGARLNGSDSHIRYELGATLTEGEQSMVITNVGPGNEGDKTKLMSQMEGSGDITDNDYRFTIEHRGRRYTEPGQSRIRMITGDAGNHDRINDSERLYPELRDEGTYFVRARWGGGQIHLLITQGTNDRGRVQLDYRMRVNGTYRPVPHLAFVGSPVGRNGPIDASVPGLIARYVYIGPVGQRPPSP